MGPLVSVITPSFNALKTLPAAMNSLLAQTYTNWECILVDDGSTDGSFEWMRQLRDPRFRAFRVESNQGRGAARQLALEHCAGKYLCMLDADDAYYPAKLEKQVRLMEAEPDLVAATAGLAIADGSGHLAGVRQHRSPLFSFAPCIVRMEAARRIGFDPSFRFCEDRDFLHRLLPLGSWTMMPEILYIYSEYLSTTLEGLLASNRAMKEFNRRNKIRVPVHRSYIVKSLIYRAVFALSLRDQMLRLRSDAPSLQDQENFEDARSPVLAASAASA